MYKRVDVMLVLYLGKIKTIAIDSVTHRPMSRLYVHLSIIFGTFVEKNYAVCNVNLRYLYKKRLENY